MKIEINSEKDFLKVEKKKGHFQLMRRRDGSHKWEDGFQIWYPDSFSDLCKRAYEIFTRNLESKYTKISIESEMDYWIEDVAPEMVNEGKASTINEAIEILKAELVQGWMCDADGSIEWTYEELPEWKSDVIDWTHIWQDVYSYQIFFVFDKD